MNCVYFASRETKRYVDAGYRWAARTLENRAIVQRGKCVDVAAVLAHGEYWSVPSEEARANRALVEEILPRVRSFLEENRSSEIFYVDDDFLSEQEELGYAWKEITTRKA